MVVSAAQNVISRSRSLMQRNVSAPGGGELEEAKFSQAHTSSLGSLSGRVIRERTVLSLFKYLMLKFSGFVSCCLFFVDLSFFMFYVAIKREASRNALEAPRSVST